MSDNPYEAPVNLENQQPEIDSIELASRFKRLVARLIDDILLLVCVALLFSLIFGFDALVALFLQAESLTQGEALVYLFLWGIHNFEDVVYLILGISGTFILQGYLLKTYGQTIGKRVLNLKILMLGTKEIPTLGRYSQKWCLSAKQVSPPSC